MKNRIIIVRERKKFKLVLEKSFRRKANSLPAHARFQLTNKIVLCCNLQAETGCFQSTNFVG